MECTNPASRDRLKLLLKIMIVVLVAVWTAIILLCLKKPASNRSPRIEDMVFSNYNTRLSAMAFTPEYKFSVIRTGPAGMAWDPDVHQYILTDIATGENKYYDGIVSRCNYVLADGELFYLFLDVSKDIYENSEPYIHAIYSFDPKTEKLEHLITYGPTDHEEDIGAPPYDVVINGKLFYFIYEHSIQVFDAEKRSCEVLYTTQEKLVNYFNGNHAKIYQNELFVTTDNGVLFSIDVLTGEETGRKIEHITTNTKLNEKARTDDFANHYWIWGNEIIYHLEDYETTVALNLISGEKRTLYHGIFTILFADEDGLYVNISDAGSNLFYFSPTEQSFEYLGAQENLPEKLMTDWVCENTYGKIRKWFYRDLLATPGEA